MKTIIFHRTGSWKYTVISRVKSSEISVFRWYLGSTSRPYANDSSIYFDTENRFSLGPGKHKNAKIGLLNSESYLSSNRKNKVLKLKGLNLQMFGYPPPRTPYLNLQKSTARPVTSRRLNGWRRPGLIHACYCAE